MSRSGPVYETSTDHVPDWRDQGECGITRLDGTRVHNIELFFPVGDTARGSQMQIAAAKEVCNRCPVKMTCLAVSLEKREPYGVWGGLTEQERAKELRRAGRARTAGHKIEREF